MLLALIFMNLYRAGRNAGRAQRVPVEDPRGREARLSLPSFSYLMPSNWVSALTPSASACPPPGSAGSLGSATSGAVVSAASVSAVTAAVAGTGLAANTDMLPTAPTASIAAVTGTRSHFLGVFIFVISFLGDRASSKVTTWREAKM